MCCIINNPGGVIIKVMDSQERRTTPPTITCHRYDVGCPFVRPNKDPIVCEFNDGSCQLPVGCFLINIRNWQTGLKFYIEGSAELQPQKLQRTAKIPEDELALWREIRKICDTQAILDFFNRLRKIQTLPKGYDNEGSPGNHQSGDD